MTPLEYIAAAHVAAALLVGAIHAVLIVAGLRAMRRASDARDRALTVQEHTADQRHTEAQRAADQRHAEAMQALREQGEALRASTTALVTLLDRTAPQPRP